MSKNFAERLKRDGNLNRLEELAHAGFNAEESKACFAGGGINLKVVAGDFPLLANNAELSRSALSKAHVKTYILNHSPTGTCVPA